MISREANVNFGHIGVSCKFRSRSVVFFKLNVYYEHHSKPTKHVVDVDTLDILTNTVVL